MSSFYERIFVLILGYGSLHQVLTAISCNSRYYCSTSEVKYISMEEIPNSYLNASAIAKHIVQNVSKCQQHCVREEKCQSINLNMSGSGELECYLLNANRYSNSSLLVADRQFIHLYIPSKCKSNPCKNDGLCVPVYHNDSFKCECKQSSLSITRGELCQILLTGYMTAFIYWHFNNHTSSVPLTSSSSDMSSYSISWPSGMEPGRRSHVVACTPGPGYCALIHNMLPCINTFSTCSATVTYSFWFKLMESQTDQSVKVLRNYGHRQRAGFSFISNANGGFYSKIAISKYKRWEIVDFGHQVNKTRWNHFTFTVDDSKMFCVFINGEKNQCDKSAASVNLDMQYNNQLRIGGNWGNNQITGMYLDEFGIWLTVLPDSEIFNLYIQSKDYDT